MMNIDGELPGVSDKGLYDEKLSSRDIVLGDIQILGYEAEAYIEIKVLSTVEDVCRDKCNKFVALI